MNARFQLVAPKIHICSTLYRPNAVSPIHTVLIDGELYCNVNKYLLAALQDGMTPDELEMTPSEEEEDFDE
jgi:hypothetical protein